MKVTGLLDGKQVTREYKANSAEQLKEKHPKAFELYHQFSFNGLDIRMHVEAPKK